MQETKDKDPAAKWKLWKLARPGADFLAAAIEAGTQVSSGHRERSLLS